MPYPTPIVKADPPLERKTIRMGRVMDYIRLMTNLSEHPKWLTTGHVGRSVLIGIWLYCGRMETDGYIPGPAARREGLTPKVATELEERGWLHRNGDGWHVHDWDEHQPSAIAYKEEGERRRAMARDRKRAERERKRLRDGHA